MFGRDEMEEICGALALPMKKFDKTIEPNPENLLDFYKVRCPLVILPPIKKKTTAT